MADTIRIRRNMQQRAEASQQDLRESLAVTTQMVTVLIDELFTKVRRAGGCTDCPAFDECPYKGDASMYGTECWAVIRTWARGQATRRKS